MRPGGGRRERHDEALRVMVAPDLVDRFRTDCEALTGGPPLRLGLAVSGGPDSLALLLLANAAFPGAVSAATVDHGLRKESAGEALFVGEICDRLDVPHIILEVVVDPARSSRQRAAREARYRALAGWCADGGLPWLATAHHLDDQAETLLMRLMRGSGVAGLAGIRARGKLPDSPVRLIRPLLGWRRERLGEVAAAAGLCPLDDPSNVDEAYDRVRMRNRLAQNPWLEPAPLARSAAALAEAEEALEWSAQRVWNERVERSESSYLFDPTDLPAEMVRRILVKLLASGGSSPRGEDVQRLARILGDGKTATLGGWRCTGSAVWRFEPEGRRGRHWKED